MGRRFLIRREARRLAIGGLLSILAHVLLVMALLQVEPPPPVPAERARDAVRLRVLDRVEQARAEREAREARAAREAVREGQIVDIAPPAVEQVPEDARFLSRYDTKVQKEQRSRHRGRPAARAAAGPAEPDGDGRPKAPGDDASVMLPGPEADTPSEAQAEAQAEGQAEGQGRATGGKPRVDLAALGRMMVPSLGPGRGIGGRLGRGAAGGLAGPTGSDDALLGVEDEGETTLVNSRSFRYWDFFQRVKENVRGTWDPGAIYQARDPTGKAYGGQDRLTVVSVVLDAQGAIQRLEVVRESGLPFLDQEAVRAFREAGPFRNPPAGLADASGRIAFNFGFLLAVGASRGRFFWQRP
ncbi:MAG TPA: TonB family protein [Myxococcota bacterium]|nr:TonB family protein [Myxococcota bacterium]